MQFLCAGREQPPTASQARAATWMSPLHVAGAHMVPRGTGLQKPTLPARAHEWQVVPQAVSQQTPSAQKLVAQSPGTMHGWPWARLPQLPLTHTAGGWQPTSGGVQLVAQAVALAQV